MLTCKEASYLASKKLDTELNWAERLGFCLHLIVCSLCRRYAEDVKKVQTMMHEASKAEHTILPDSIMLPEESRNRIKQVLNEAFQKNE